MKKKKEVELNICECGEKPEIIEVKMHSIWKDDEFFTCYKVKCKCGRHTILSNSKNMVISYWNNGSIWGGK